MQESFWWRQCSDRYIISLFPILHTPFSPSLISLMVSVDVKHHVWLLFAPWRPLASVIRVTVLSSRSVLVGILQPFLFCPTKAIGFCRRIWGNSCVLRFRCHYLLHNFLFVRMKAICFCDRIWGKSCVHVISFHAAVLLFYNCSFLPSQKRKRTVTCIVAYSGLVCTMFACWSLLYLSAILRSYRAD